LRLWFEYNKNYVRLVSVEQLKMIPPPPQATLERNGEFGSSLELQDQSGKPLYRRIIDNPLQQEVEVVTEAPEHSLARVPADTSGTFYIVVPDIPHATKFVLKAAPRVVRAEGGEGSTAHLVAVHEFELNIEREGGPQNEHK
jgi:hypothetical protein